MNEITINGQKIGHSHPVYFVADIAANHDSDLARATELIYMCAEAGANAAKFQHFSAETIVSDHGFRSLGFQLSHQASWKKSVYDTYRDASVSLQWTETLRETCEKAGIAFFTSPYSVDWVEHVDPYVSAYKIGSGDITWHEIIRYMASKGKPVLMASGASTFDEVCEAVAVAQSETQDLVLMQCNTNYTGSEDNFKYINLNVLKSFVNMFPEIVLGLSDHTPGHSTTLGAVTLGARVIEKHFTDDRKRTGPDHNFSMDPGMWKEMVDRTRELEFALGTGIKKIEANETETVILQRRCIRLRVPVTAGTVVKTEMLEVLRPCPSDGLPPHKIDEVIGLKVTRNMVAGDYLRWNTLTSQ